MIALKDGTERLVDLKPHLGGEVFEPLKDIAFFRRVRVDPDSDTIAWENRADMFPDFLYEIGVPTAESASAG